MIGPHEGKELSLMLADQKPMAFFHDAIAAGKDIPEEIIPENAFSPYVASGRLKRFSADILPTGRAYTIRYVCFTQPGEEWRARAFFWLINAVLSGQRKNSEADDIMIGRLLGYEEDQISAFLEHQKKFTS